MNHGLTMTCNPLARSLSGLLQDSMSPTIRRKGEEYYRWGSVRHVTGDRVSVEAKVQGTSLYHVWISYLPEGPEMQASCTCPYFSTHSVCKHLWAVLLAAEKENFLSAVVEDQWKIRPDQDPDEDWGGADEWQPSDDEEDEWPGATGGRSGRIKRLEQPPAGALRNLPSWKKRLDVLEQQIVDRQSRTSLVQNPWPASRQLLYIIDMTETLRNMGLAVEIAVQEIKKDGRRGKARPHSMRRDEIDHLPDAQDRRVMATLAGGADASYSWGFSYDHYGSGFHMLVPSRILLSPQLSHELVPLMCDAGRCYLRRRIKENSELLHLRWDDGPAWDFSVEVVPEPDGKHYTVKGALRRGEQLTELSAPLLVTATGLVFTAENASRLEHHDAFDWILHLRQNGSIRIPVKDGGAALERLLTMPVQVPLRLPPELQFEEARMTPKVRLKLHKPRQVYVQSKLPAHWEFDYDGTTVHAEDRRAGIYQAEQRRLLVRDHDAEQRAAARLRELGFRDPPSYERSQHNLLELPPKRLPAIVKQLLGEGWHVEAEGKLYRTPGRINVQVSSGLDWFELHADVAFDDQAIPLPRLLQALRRGDGMVQLGDGTFGLLPDEWLKKYAPLASMGEAHDDHLRFRPMQVGFLDALLAMMPEARCDELFARVREQLRRFDGVNAVDAPPQFTGELRPYQREGLGWLRFLREFRFGGCLADDMGLGKTVQVLAKLEARRQEKIDEANRDKHEKVQKPLPRPSLVVVPRSLVFNWKQEAARFTPELRVLDHTGAERLGRNGQSLDHFEDYDVVLTTYGTLRRDAAKLKDVQFDYAILDEAQAVKNPATASAKAARLLRARHRLVLTGTPVENHLGDLWSLFEFLNPGMLGSVSVFKEIGAGAKQVSAETRELLGRALRPFILRRTKEQVARDLPKKTEQTLYCELKTPQRKLYDELRDHYRRTLLANVARQGINRSKIQVLEALLRLRQAACHPGLIDPARRDDASAKLDALLPQLEEVVDEGHKALVFSQFTSLLSIVRQRLDARTMCYEYLDGQTHDRAARVERFQNDKDCPLFLISLKAGGLGLNLTAAEYVFLLDPWWNPAVEAQAIDRAHRIGQERQVFAYRLIAKDTVEEKVLDLQRTKRDLADAIVNADNSLIRDLGREDLELLLS